MRTDRRITRRYFALRGRADHLRATHICNAYCAGDVHCDLLYSNSSSVYHVCRVLGDEMRVEIVRGEPAREAPDLAALPPNMRQVVIGDAPVDGYRTLFWWRLPQGAYRPQTQGEVRRAIHEREGH